MAKPKKALITNVIYIDKYKENDMINSILIARPKQASRSEFHDAINVALGRARNSKRNVGVFEDRKGKLHVQNIQPNSIQYFGRSGILYSTGV
jgi:hypothetical protein